LWIAEPVAVRPAAMLVLADSLARTSHRDGEADRRAWATTRQRICQFEAQHASCIETTITACGNTARSSASLAIGHEGAESERRGS
jgi:hypothetical protein